jgi:hypothetical protein
VAERAGSSTHDLAGLALAAERAQIDIVARLFRAYWQPASPVVPLQGVRLRLGSVALTDLLMWLIF